MYHSLVGDFDRRNEEHKKKYQDLLDEYNYFTNPSGKPDSDFHGKPPSKERFRQLQIKLRKYYKQKEKKRG